MKYQKNLPATTYIIQNSVTVPQKSGPSLFYNGIYLKFTGNPPEADTVVTAKGFVRDEIKMRRVKSSEFDMKVKEIDAQIQATMENNEDYIQGRVWRADPAELLRKFGINKCVLCTTGDPRVFQSEELLAEHLRFEHGIKKTTEKPKENDGEVRT